MKFFLLAYLKTHRAAILTGLICIALFLLSFALYGLPFEAVLYPALLSLLFIAIVFLFRFFLAWKKHQRLTLARSMTSETLLPELEPSTDVPDADYLAILEALCREAAEQATAREIASQETADYFTTWTHQIKTPLASMRLKLEAEDSARSRQLLSDLRRVDQYVEMVLTYLRVGATATDYEFREAALDPLIREQIRKVRGDFILRKNKLLYDGTDAVVLTDEKWLSFVIGQLLSNALKYTERGTIKVIASNESLTVADTGIGIEASDLPRVFEKGFTGRNGRLEKNASGLGLYLCKTICEKLGLTISAESTVGRGTSVTIHFPRKN